MTWEQTHRRYRLLHETELLIEHQHGGPLPWTPDLAEAFGDRDALLLALRHRWRQRLEAQVDPELGPDAESEARERLRRRHRGLVALLEHGQCGPRDHAEEVARAW